MGFSESDDSCTTGITGHVPWRDAGSYTVQLFQRNWLLWETRALRQGTALLPAPPLSPAPNVSLVPALLSCHLGTKLSSRGHRD